MHDLHLLRVNARHTLRAGSSPIARADNALLQGYLARIKPCPPRTLQEAYA